MFLSMLLTVTLALHPNDRPKLVEAQGLIESGINKFARGKRGEKGAWQVIERYHGKVSGDIRLQMDQHLEIMSRLYKEKKGNIVATVKSYNGKGAGASRYYRKVCKKTLELQILGV